MQASSPCKIAITALALAALASSQAFARPASTLNTIFAGPIADDVPGSNSVATSFVLIDDNSSQTVQSVQSIMLTDLTHTYSSDLYVSLQFILNGSTTPAREAVLFDGLNDGFDFLPNQLDGTYSFATGAVGTLQAAAQPYDGDAVVPAGTYAPSAFYLEGDAADLQDLTTAFAGVNLANGNFVLHFEDFAAGDSGTLGSASLMLTTSVVPEPTAVAAIGLAGIVSRRRRLKRVAQWYRHSCLCRPEAKNLRCANTGRNACATV